MCGRYDNLIAREAYRGLYKVMRAALHKLLTRPA